MKPRKILAILIAILMMGFVISVGYFSEIKGNSITNDKKLIEKYLFLEKDSFK